MEFHLLGSVFLLQLISDLFIEPFNFFCHSKMQDDLGLSDFYKVCVTHPSHSLKKVPIAPDCVLQVFNSHVDLSGVCVCCIHNSLSFVLRYLDSVHEHFPMSRYPYHIAIFYVPIV